MRRHDPARHQGGGGAFDLKIRVPRWAARGVFVTFNGRDQAVKAVPGNYLALRRRWRTGDVSDIRMLFAFHLTPVMDQPNVASVFYGPLLLAAEESAPRSDWRPITVDTGDLARSVTGDRAPLRFTIDGVHFKPYFETYGRSSVYLHATMKEGPRNGRCAFVARPGAADPVAAEARIPTACRPLSALQPGDPQGIPVPMIQIVAAERTLSVTRSATAPTSIDVESLG